jgi:hypothetical protein
MMVGVDVGWNGMCLDQIELNMGLGEQSDKVRMFDWKCRYF